MRAMEAMRRIADITASQWGMVTARQAKEAGVGRLELSRLANAGQLERLEQGVYRDAGAPGDELEHLRAAWLSTEPARLAGERILDREDGIVISGPSAAVLHRIGDFREDAHEFTTSTRRQTNRPDIRYRKRTLHADAVTIKHGLPVTTPEQTIADLVNDYEDLSLIAQVVHDASNDRLNLHAVEAVINETAARKLGAANAAELWARIIREARVDDQSIAREIAASPIGALVAGAYLDQIRDALSQHSAEEVRTMTSNLIPATVKAALDSALGGAGIVKVASTPVLDVVQAQLASASDESTRPLQRELTRTASAAIRQALTRAAAGEH